MSRQTKIWPLSVLLVLLILFFNIWMWDNDTLILGLPINLLYHIGLCVLTTLCMLVIVRLAWPHHLDMENRE
ncbi:MAG: DUF3311 domain-containing protein [Gemmatimonadetes bacterium]|nr:DUF3311 domain-containing protein [Gemmatimonadota bacterium]MXX14464.1 DUF3311 domain-containing protein [Gemmatimonadota bacterium]MXZ12344.1 DUF3311 domain-containing protein [Gemmatimonadota bacterium]MYB55409.1 DUF3311 domain-containing protein [Gemmatimonadota bacterium]MYC16272.1 DUF3311 domain-containing protein [Gemmatimonadota bacterium]